MSFFSKNFKFKAENERRQGIVAALNHQIDYLRRKIAYESGLTAGNLGLQESIQDCERKVTTLSDIVTELNGYVGDWAGLLRVAGQKAVEFMDFNKSHESTTALVLYFLGKEEYSEVNKIFANHEQSFEQTPKVPLSFEFFKNTPQQTVATSVRTPKQPCVDKKVSEAKAAINAYVAELKVEVQRKRFNPFAGYIAKMKLNKFETLADKIKDAEKWAELRDEVVMLHAKSKKALSSGLHQKSRAIGLITNILKNQPAQGTDCSDYSLTETDVSFTNSSISF